MPEQLTKHPQVTLQVLRSAGAQCGEGAPQQILTQCPAERFCKLPGGEVCVYGLAEAPRMTQITAADWTGVLQALPPPHDRAAGAGADTAPAWLIGGAGLLVGLLLGALAMRFERRRAARR